MFGSPSKGGGSSIDWEARNRNRDLAEQNKELQAAVVGKDAVIHALKDALYQDQPGHPLVDPFEAGQNETRNDIFKKARDAELARLNQGGRR